MTIMMPSGLTPIRNQISYLLTSNTRAIRLPEVFYDKMRDLKNTSLVLDKSCNINGLMYVHKTKLQTMPIFTGPKFVNIGDNTMLFADLLTSVVAQTATITVVYDDTEFESFVCKHDVYVMFKSDKYVYMYNHIKKAKQKLHEEMLDSEHLARVLYSPERVCQHIYDSQCDDILELSFDDM